MQHRLELNLVASNEAKITTGGKVYSWGVVFGENACSIMKRNMNSDNTSSAGRRPKNRSKFFPSGPRTQSCTLRSKAQSVGFPLARTRFILPFHIPPQQPADRQSGGIGSPCPQNNLIPQTKLTASARQQGKRLLSSSYLQRMTVTLKTHDQ